MESDGIVVEWTDKQTEGISNCQYCLREDVPYRIEPFGQQRACKKCWEQICYGEED